MIRASALYIVIVIALVIAVICSSLIAVAYYYKIGSQQKIRFDRLENNLSSGVSILLADSGNYADEKTIDLYGALNDSITIRKISWGIFDIGVINSFAQKDTLTTVFSIGQLLDSSRWSTLYLVDEDRPLSVSGKTSIKGTAFLPKSGVRSAYVNNESYQGDKRIVAGSIKVSNKILPEPEAKRLEAIKELFAVTDKDISVSKLQDSVSRSFKLSTLSIDFKDEPVTISQSLNGNILIRSDTTVTIDGSARLNNVIVAAKSIKVLKGFSGTCQLFASDSLTIEPNSTFLYPSCIGVLERYTEHINQPFLSIGENSMVSGTVFSYQKTNDQKPAIIRLDKAVIIRGQLYASGVVSYKDNLKLNGSVATTRFLYQTSNSLYENYLINVSLNAQLPEQFMFGMLLPVYSRKKDVLQWLEKK